jgi:hypothetical protein
MELETNFITRFTNFTGVSTGLNLPTQGRCQVFILGGATGRAKRSRPKTADCCGVQSVRCGAKVPGVWGRQPQKGFQEQRPIECLRGKVPEKSYIF